MAEAAKTVYNNFSKMQIVIVCKMQKLVAIVHGKRGVIRPLMV